MLSLALETSGGVGSVALLRDRREVLDERTFPHGLQHAAAVVPMIDRLVADHGAGPRDLAEIYVSIGPGSFTGLRVAVTLAKTFCFATGARVVAVPTASVLVQNAPADAAEVITLLDAKRGQVFTARYTRVPDGWHEAEAAHLDTLAAMLGRTGRPVWLIGEGLAHHPPPDEAGVLIAPPDAWRCRAGVVATLGAAMAEREQFADVMTLTPLYVRLPEAEEKRLART